MFDEITRETIRIDDPLEKIIHFFHQILDTINERSGLLRFILKDFEDITPSIQIIREEFTRNINQIIHQFLEEGKAKEIFCIEDIQQVTVLIVKTLLSLMITLSYGEPANQLKEDIRDLMHLFAKGIMKK